MTRRLPLVALTLLTLEVGLTTSYAAAEPIVITSGSMVVTDERLGIVDIQGTQGFSAQLRLDLLVTTGPWGCSLCPPGTPVDLNAYFSAGDGGGTVVYGGNSYRVPGEFDWISIQTAGGPLIIPPLGDGVVALSAPFEIRYGILTLLSPGSQFDTSIFRLHGGGTATLELTPDFLDQGWRMTEARYEFAPVPEPASLLLLGAGTIGLMVKRYRQCHPNLRA